MLLSVLGSLQARRLPHQHGRRDGAPLLGGVSQVSQITERRNFHHRVKIFNDKIRVAVIANQQNSCYLSLNETQRRLNVRENF